VERAEGSEQGHDADEQVPADSRDPQELRGRTVGLPEHVADGAAEADDGVEGLVAEATEVDDVEQFAGLDRVFDGRGLLRMELELPGRDVARDDRRPEASELEGEPPRARTCLENPHPGSDELAE
jgi:hypothetical protein